MTSYQDDVEAVQRVPGIEEMLAQICRATGMGFAAVARVTGERWICCHVLDRIEFGLNPGDELEIKTTICNEIRESGKAVYIDDVAGNFDWSTHHTPALYGFKSYISFPIVLANGSFFGTLCAIDPVRRERSLAEVVPLFEDYAARIAHALSKPAP